MAFDADSSGREAARRLAAGLRQETLGQQAPGMTVSRFRAPGADVGGLGTALVRWYEEQGLESDAAEMAGSMVVRCRSKGGRGLVGAARGLTVVLRQEGPDLAVEIGAARWSDKAWVAGAGVLLMSTGVGIIPLAASAVGAWRQWRLPAQTLDFLRATSPSFSDRRPTSAQHVRPSADHPPPRHEEWAQPDAPSCEVNSADAAQLARVPGLDASAARALVAERDRLRGFASWDQVREVLVQRIEPHQLARVRPFLTLVPAQHAVPDPARRSRSATEPSGRGPLDL